MRKRQFATIPLHFNLPDDVKSITAITQHKNELVVALNPLIIYSFPLEFRNSLPFQLGSMKKITMKKNDYTIKDLKSIGSILLIFVKSKTSRGSLFMLTEDGQLKGIINSIDCFAVNLYATDDQPYYLLTGTDKILTLYKCDIPKVGQQQTHSKKGGKEEWIKTWTKEFPYQILAISLSYPYSFVLTSDKMYSLQIEPENINSLPSQCVPAPYTMPCSHKSFFTYYAHSSMKIDHDLSSNFPPISFKDLALDHAYNGKMFASLLPNNVSLYDFERVRGKAHIENPQRITSYDGDKFILATEKELYYLSDVSAQMEDVIAGVASSIEGVSVDTLAAIFQQLWLTNKKEKAVSMIKYENFQEAIPSVLKLFDFFVLPESMLHRDVQLSLNPGSFDTKTVYKSLYKSLLAFRFSYLNNNNMNINTSKVNVSVDANINTNSISDILITEEFINTMICQLLSKMDDSIEIEKFFEKKPKIDEDLMTSFYHKNHCLIYPFFLRFLGKIDAALNEFAKNNNYDDYCRTLIMKASDFEFVRSHLDFLIANAPLKACEVLACDQISPQKSIKLVREKYPSIITPVLRSLINHKEILDREELANSFVTQMVNMISNINSPKFDLSLVAFTNCVIKNPKAPLSEIENELSEILADFLIKYRDLINLNILLSNIKTFTSLHLKIEIFKAANQIDKAFELIYKKDDNSFEACEKLCEQEKNPDILHSYFLFIKNIMNSPTSKNSPNSKNSSNSTNSSNLMNSLNSTNSVNPNEAFAKYLFDSIARFISFVDIERTLSLIGEETTFDSELQDNVEKTFAKVNQSRMNTQMRAAFAESDLFESEFEKTKLECNCVELNATSECSVCHKPLGYCFVQKTPEGQFCHYRCLGSKK